MRFELSTAERGALTKTMQEYSTTDAVPKTSAYVCTSCGETTEFETGDDFSVCAFCDDDTASWVIAIQEDAEEALGEETPEEEPTE